MVKSLLDAETGQRGYLLTDRKEYLRPYSESLAETRALLAWLTAYYAKDAKTAPVMTDVARETEAKLSELATTIELHDNGVENGWRELLLSDIGREKMEHVRTLGEQLINYETAQVEIGRRSVYETLLLNRIGVSAMAAVSLLALFMYLRQTATLDRTLARGGAAHRRRARPPRGRGRGAHRAAARARPAFADDPRRRAQPPRARAARRARRPAHRGQARRRPPEVAARRRHHARSGWSASPTSTKR